MKKEKNNKNSLRLFQFYLPVTVQKIPVQWNVPLKSWQLVDSSFLFNYRYMPFSYNFLTFLNNWGSESDPVGSGTGSGTHKSRSCIQIRNKSFRIYNTAFWYPHEGYFFSLKGQCYENFVLTETVGV